LLLGLAAIICHPDSIQDKRLLVPEDAALKEAEKLVRDLFKDDLAKKAPADKRSLAKKLLTQGREAANAPASQYALLALAIDQSIQAGDVDTVLLAVGELGNLFSIDIVAMRGASLASLAKSVKTSEDLKSVAKAYLQLADEALKADNFDDSAKAAAESGTLARRAKELALVGAADAKSKEVAARKVRFEKVRKAKELLAAMPDDPAANLAVGQYCCFAKNDWAAGLACLAKSPDGNLKSVALKDAANPESPDEKAAVGDGWWDLSETAPPEDKVALRDRAGSWYRQAIAKIAGLGKVKVEKRLLQWNGERLLRGSWIDFNDPAQFGLKGRPGEPLEVIHTVKGTVTPVNTKPFPPGEFDGFTMRFRFKMEDPDIHLGYKGPGSPAPCSVIFSGKARTVQITGEKGPNGPVQILPITLADEYVIAVLCFKGEDTVFFNGGEIGRFPNPVGHFDSFQMFCHLGTTTIDKIRLRKR
jgi:hypothetical protein